MAIASTPVLELQIRSPRLNQHLGVLCVAAVVAAAHVPLLWIHCTLLWARPHYQFFPIVFVGAAILAWSALKSCPVLRLGNVWISWAVLAWSWTMLAGAEVLNSSWLGAVAFLFQVLALIYTVGGRVLLRKMVPAWIYLWLVIPPPFSWDQYLVVALQRLTTQWSSAVLDLFRIYHVVAGNVVEIGERRFFVAEACAGINSLFSICACALFYILWVRPSLVRSCFLFASAIFWVLLANVARVFLVVYLDKQVNLSDGWRHDAFGFALFSIALLLIWSTDRLLLALAPSRKNAGAHAEGPAVANSRNGAHEDVLAQLARTWLKSPAVGVAFGLLLFAHIALYSIPDASAALAAATPEPERLRRESLPDMIDGWKLREFREERRNPGSAFGEYSKTWAYQADTDAAAFSLDYPFGMWHELQECYRNQGWEVEKQADHASKTPGTPTWYSTRTLKKTGHRTAYLFYCEFDQLGRAIEPARPGLSYSWSRRETALKRLQSWLGQAEPAEPAQVGTLFQFQMLLKCNTPLTDLELTKARDRFFLAYGALRQNLF